MNYRLPLDFKSLMEEQGQTPMCSTAESIAQNIMLLIITRKGEHRYDPNYGNDVWELEFDNAITKVIWETVFTESLKKQLKEHEPRIRDPNISVHVTLVEHTYETKNFVEIKKKASIAINAFLVETGERYRFATELFLSPMSID